jgi:hypothetical protein
MKMQQNYALSAQFQSPHLVQVYVYNWETDRLVWDTRYRSWLRHYATSRKNEVQFPMRLLDFKFT